MTRQQWVNGQTIGNGFCGYHAISEVFLRIVRHQPERLNPALFEEDNPIFQPVQDFFSQRFQLEKPLSVEKLSEAFKAMPAECEQVLKNITPALLILLLNYYKEALNPLFNAYNNEIGQSPQQASENRKDYLDRVFNDVIKKTTFHDRSVASNACEEDKKYALFQLEVDCTSQDELTNMIAIMSKRPMIGEFLSEPSRATLTPDQVDAFINWVNNQGLSHAEYATEGVLQRLIRLMFLPSRRDQEHAFVYPCALALQGLNSYTCDLNQTEQPYLIRCIGNYHFEYSFASEIHEQYGETPSTFRAFSFANFVRRPSAPVNGEPLDDGEIDPELATAASLILIPLGIALGVYYPVVILCIIGLGFCKYSYDCWYGDDPNGALFENNRAPMPPVAAPPTKQKQEAGSFLACQSQQEAKKGARHDIECCCDNHYPFQKRIKRR